MLTIALRKSSDCVGHRTRDVVRLPGSRFRLERHDIVAEPLALTAKGEYVVSHDAIAQKEDADLIVAGAYGHSRFHEWVLGGVTRDLLMYSSRCFLLSH